MAIRIINNNYGGRVSISSRGLGGKFNYGADPIPLLLDLYPTAAAAFSLRKLNTNYTGSAIRIRRSSDNAETNIGFSGRYLDKGAISTFAAGSSAFVTTWYDQSGNARNAVQATAGSQPRIVNSGVIDTLKGLPTTYYNGTSTGMSFTPNMSGSNAVSTFSFTQKGNSSNLNRRLLSFVSNAGNDYNSLQSFIIIYNNNSVSNQRNSAGPSLTMNYTTVQSPTLLTTIISGSINGIAYNNTTLTTAATTNVAFNSPTTAYLGTSPASEYWDGNISEMVIYYNDQTINRSGINNNMNYDYATYPQVTDYWTGGSAMMDSYPSASVAFSLRNLYSNYTGPLITIRRASDNMEMDVYGNSAGQLNTNTITNYCGTSSAYVSRWYDQSGNGRNAGEGTFNNQPRIALSGSIDLIGSKPSLYLSPSTTNGLAFTPNLTASNAISYFVPLKKGSSTNPNVRLLSFVPSSGADYNSLFGFALLLNSNTISMQRNQAGPSIAYTYQSIGGSAQIITGVISGTTNSMAFYTSSFTTVATTNTVFNAPSYAGIGRSTAGESIDGYIPELIMFYSDQTAIRTSLATAINSYYTIY
jgi:hypothetical protein